jgi:hypothetical protein
MTAAGAFFFVFDQQQAARLAARPDFLDGIDCVISTVPGITLDGISSNVTCLTLEQALDLFSIRQRSISERGSRYALALLDKDATEGAFRMLGLDEGVGVRVALLNHVALLVHNAFAFELLFGELIAQGMRGAWCFAFSARFRMLERLDIKTLLHLELSFGPQLSHLCHNHGIALQMVSGGSSTAQLRNTLRTLLLSGYKGMVLLRRSLAARGQERALPCDAVFVVRAQTEIEAAEPLLRWRADQGLRDCLLVDDLIKSPNGTLTARQSGFAWYPLQGFLSPGRLAGIFLATTLRTGRAAHRAVPELTERMAHFGFLGQPAVARAVLRTAFSTLPESVIFHRQLDRALTETTPSALVSFDTVDRWGAVQGAQARGRRLRSVMVQNSSVDDIEYPYPLSMDDLVVASERLRGVFINSGAPADRVHAFGLPLQDSARQTGDARISQLRKRSESADPGALRILVATQPFVQAFDYNAALLADLVEALRPLTFEFTLVLKPHPREEMDRYRATVETLSNEGLRVTLFEQNFEAALDVADVVLSRTSTSIEFAALGGIPTIAHLNKYPTEVVERLDYIRDPVTVKTYNISDLRIAFAVFQPAERTTALARYSAQRDAYLAEHFPSNGLSTRRVAALIAGDAQPAEAGAVQC